MIETTVLGALLAGLLSFVTPCVLPLVPPYLGYLAGATLDEVRGESVVARAAQRRMIFFGFAFVLGFTTVFVLLGATASALGRLILRYSADLSVVAGIVIIVMGLHFLGVFRIPFLYRELRFDSRNVKAGPLGAYVMGLAFGFGWTPCIGPVLATILAVAGSRDTVAQGAGLLAVYSLGLGLPFMLAALFAGPFLSFMRRFRTFMPRVEQAMGVILILTGILFISGGLKSFSFWLLETFPAFARIG